jgi:putative Ca2+/H+ antiporter (TMEM165/GDT1 family)
MVLADGLAIAVGKALGDRLQANTVRVASSVAFFVFAAIMFIDALR